MEKHKLKQKILNNKRTFSKLKNRIKNNKNKKKTFYRCLFSYVFKILILSCFLFAVSVESIPATVDNTEKVVGKIQELNLDYNPGLPCILTFKINNNEYSLAWIGFSGGYGYEEAVEQIKTEKEICLTVKSERAWTSVKKSYVKRVVDVRSENSVYYDIAHYNKIEKISLVLAIFMFIFIFILFSFWFVLQIKIL